MFVVVSIVKHGKIDPLEHSGGQGLLGCIRCC
jgi:hypothetical protein